MAKRMKSGYTVNEIQDIIQTAIDTANDDKGYGVEGALDDLYSLIDSEEKELTKISDASLEVFMLYDKEVKWRKDASENLMPELDKYNLVINNNIGLRLQSRLTKDQAKFVAKCNSIHRDISLNF